MDASAQTDAEMDEEALHQQPLYSTAPAEQRAELSTNKHVKSLIRSGVDLIAADAWYHRSCRAKFLSKTDRAVQKAPMESSVSPQLCHKNASASICSYIQVEVIEEKRSIFVSGLLEMYKAEYISMGGDQADVESYWAQNLQRKTSISFGDKIKIKLADQRRGNFVFNSVIPEDEAFARLHCHAEEHLQNDKLRWAALHLRSQIMKLPKSRTHNPATVQNLKESAPDIPAQLDLFFRSLLGGLTPKFRGAQKDGFDRKVTSMASDAIFNVTGGTVKPWKHTAVGLGMASLTGSKLTLQILNRSGHSISYSETRGIETEFAYSVESCDHHAPDGIKLNPGLATASVWDNNDANVETLDGKATLHTTVGHTY
ncbi:hypothetical protein Pcinc_032271 [Petrolisthes cinctipes]|uniref:Uncharacterized protein n=1 Tax=Petrolisthes cinctipes TaxID=88211 RepID=A0AAE1EUW3_PETCI|nr:hypothetical protein Pcinc_032271 [Petrolisthes cinctipes]